MTLVLIFFGLLSLIVVGLIWGYRRVCRRPTERYRSANIEQSREWAWPPKEAPRAETHLGKQQLGRKAA